MNIEELKLELERTYRVLFPDQADMQNHCDICGWRDSNIISNNEAKELFRYNRELYKQHVWQ